MEETRDNTQDLPTQFFLWDRDKVKYKIVIITKY